MMQETGRCQKCGAVLPAASGDDPIVLCPMCGTRHQRVAADPPVGQVQPNGPADTPRLAEGIVIRKRDWGYYLERSLPWAASLIFHLGILVLMAFVVWSVQQVSRQRRIIVPAARLSDEPGSGLKSARPESPSADQDLLSEMSLDLPVPTEPQTPAETPGRADMPLSVIGLGAGGAGTPLSAFSATGGGAGAAPSSSFMGTGGNAYRICYVIDRSGSMVLEFDLVKRELIRSIQQLEPQQAFHLIFFSAGQPVENPPKRFVPATDYNKVRAIQFIKKIVPEGLTDPAPALKRAFALRPRPDLIYFMTDGDFDPAILQSLRQWNRDGATQINTIAFLNRAGEPLLRRIAAEHHGQYRFVGQEEMAGRTR